MRARASASPARGICKDDSSCGADQKCDLSACRLPPMTTTTADPARAAVRRASKCGPQAGPAERVCADGSVSGPTGRCLLNADGSCGWEILDCAPTPGCYGICVPNVPADRLPGRPRTARWARCVTSQCREWGCAAGGTGSGSTHEHRSGDRRRWRRRCPRRCACDLDRQQLRLRRQRQLQGPDVRRPVRAAEADLRSEQAGRLPDVRAGLPERPDADPDRRRSEHLLRDVHLPGLRPARGSSTGAASICPAIRCACAKVVGTDPAPAAARSTSAARSTPTAPAGSRSAPQARSDFALIPPSPLRGGGDRIFLDRPLTRLRERVRERAAAPSFYSRGFRRP